MRQLSFCVLLVSLALPLQGQTSFGNLFVPPVDSTRTDTLGAVPGSSGKPLENKIKIVKRKIDYRNFVILAVAMMAYIALIFTTTQAWNPGARNP
jgi:hypothetical protein